MSKYFNGEVHSRGPLANVPRTRSSPQQAVESINGRSSEITRMNIADPKGKHRIRVPLCIMKCGSAARRREPVPYIRPPLALWLTSCGAQHTAYMDDCLRSYEQASIAVLMLYWNSQIPIHTRLIVEEVEDPFFCPLLLFIAAGFWGCMIRN